MGKPNQKIDMNPATLDDEKPVYKEPYRKYPSQEDYEIAGQGNPGAVANYVNDRGYKEYR